MDDGYASQYSVLYWKFTDIKECYQLKARIPASCSKVSYGDRKIKCLQELAWWLIDVTLRGKIIDQITLRLIFLLVPLSSPSLILKTQEMEKVS